MIYRYEDTLRLKHAKFEKNWKDFKITLFNINLKLNHVLIPKSLFKTTLFK